MHAYMIHSVVLVDRFIYAFSLSFSGGSDSKESTCNVEDLGSVPGLGRSSGEEHGNPLHDSCLENPQGQNLSGYSSWNCKQSDMTEQLLYYFII